MPIRPSYDIELACLHETYATALALDASRMRDVFLGVAVGPAVFVGTGGTIAVARLAAHLHEQVAGQPARVATPLEFARLPPMLRSGAVVFTAGASHPDAVGVLARLGTSRFRPAVLVTLRDPSDLVDVAALGIEIVGLPALPFREGFLATNSVLAMMTALIRAYEGEDALPRSLPIAEVPLPSENTEALLVLTTPETSPVGTDLETRCEELGLAFVQVTDYRNFAHGRHVGLARRAASTAVVGLAAEPLLELATATLEMLPAEIERVVWKARCHGSAAVIELLTASMRLAGERARTRGVNAARPGAAPFGRRLYHLPLRGLVPPSNDGPVERKLVALAASAHGGTTRALYEDAFRDWSKQVREVAFGGIVLDYDGTVCSTEQRFDLPAPSIRAGLMRLLDADLTIGFASGRGKSLHRDLRAWVPPDRWAQVLVGLYNGGVILHLSEDVPDLAAPSDLMAACAERVRALPIGPGLRVEARSVQVTVGIQAGAFAHIGRLTEIIADTLAREPALAVKVVASGHSVDVVPATTTKVTVVEATKAARGLPALAVGDQGDFGGNDFELLAASAWTLSVDRCSADPTRCWYLDKEGRSGPALLETYLDATHLSGTSFSFEWKGR
jgi:hypothetical protein